MSQPRRGARPAGKRTAPKLDGPVPEWLTDPRYARSLAIGVSVLESFDTKQPLLGIADIADMLGLSRSTVHRYATTLVALGWLEQTSTRKYMLAQRSAYPGMALLEEIMLGTGAEPVLRELRNQTGYTTSLGVLDGSRVTYVCRLPGHRKGQFEADGGLRAGAHVPLHCTAVGKALLASLPEQDPRELLARVRLTHRARRTITVKKRLVEELERVRADGLAVSDRELNDGECSLAVAIHGLRCDRCLAVEVCAPVAMIGVEGLRAHAGRPLWEAAERMSAGLQSATQSFCPQTARKK